MEMIGINQRRVVRISPAFSIEMKTNHEIRMQFRVYQNRAPADFAVAIKKDLALKLDRALLLRVFWIQNFVAWPWHAVLNQNRSRELFEIGWAFRGDRLSTVAHEQNRRAEFSQSWREHARNAQRQVALGHGFVVADFEPALFHLRPFAAEMSGIESDP